MRRVGEHVRSNSDTVGFAERCGRHSPVATYASYQKGAKVRNRTFRSFFAAALLAVGIGLMGCGGGATTSSGSPNAAGSPAAASSPATVVGSYAANLTFTGSLAGTATQGKVPSGTPVCGDSVGHILLAVTLNGHDYDLLVTNTAYKGLAKYTLGDISSATSLLLSDAGSGGTTIYFSASGTITYTSAKSINIDADLVGGDVKGGSSPNLSAHVAGSASCS